MNQSRHPRRRLTFTSLALLLGAAASGCGDDAPVDDDPTPDAEVDPDANPPGPSGPYSEPDDFPREGCSPGAFVGGGFGGVYNYVVEYEGGWESWESMRIDEGADLAGLFVGAETDDVHLFGDDDLIVRAEFGEQMYALDVCGRDGDGALHGTWVFCGGPDCYEFPAVIDHLPPLEPEVSSGVTLLGEYGPWPADPWSVGLTVNARVDGDVAYLARYQDGLRILDISDPANITELGHQPNNGGGIWNDVKLARGPGGHRYALMGSSVEGVVVVDVEDPSAPEIVTHFPAGFEPGASVDVHTLFVDDGKVYFTNIGSGLEIWDIVDPSEPVFLGAMPLASGGFIHDLYVEGDRAYINAWEQGMHVVDVSDPSDPQIIGTFANYGENTSHSSWVTTVGARRIAVHGDEERGSHVHLVDVTEGTDTFMDLIAEWDTRPSVSVHNVMAFGDLAILAYYQDGLRLLDLSNPEAPVAAGHFQTMGQGAGYGHWPFEGALGVDVDLARDRIYVADSHRGLIVLELDR